MIIATITLLEFAAANPILAVVLFFISAACIVGVFNAIAHSLTGTPVPPPKSPWDKKDE